MEINTKRAIVWTKKAEKDLAGLDDKKLRGQIEAEIASLGDSPRPNGALKLKDPRLAHFEGTTYRLRVRTHRVLYAVIDVRSECTVLRIEHRREVYD